MCFELHIYGSLRSSEMWCCIFWWLLSDVSRHREGLVFEVLHVHVDTHSQTLLHPPAHLTHLRGEENKGHFWILNVLLVYWAQFSWWLSTLECIVSTRESTWTTFKSLSWLVCVRITVALILITLIAKFEIPEVLSGWVSPNNRTRRLKKYSRNECSST